MAETPADKSRMQVEDVCTELDELEAKGDRVADGDRASHEEQIADLTERCEVLQSTLAESEHDEGSQGEDRRRSLGLLETARSRLARMRTSSTGERTSGSVQPDVVCTDELDEPDKPGSGALEGSVLNVGGGVAGLMPIEGRRTRRLEDDPDDDQSGGA